jgi:hypothetical protein
MTTVKSPFALDPTLPWLFSDPKMQVPAAFIGVQILTLSKEDYEPMGLYFPASTKLAIRRVTSLDQLIEGAAYWSEIDHYEESTKKVVTSCRFGRYAGLAHPESKGTPSRWKRGEAHILLEVDVMDCNLGGYFFREDGTDTRFVDIKTNSRRLYQVTHYVGLPESKLTELGPGVVKHTGLTLRQACWLQQERELQKDSVELTMEALGMDLPDYRVVLPFDQIRDFLTVQESLLPVGLTASQAKRCKAGAVAIKLRHNNNGRTYTETEHYKLADAALLFDWMRHHSSVQETALNAAIVRQAIGLKAEAVKAKWKAEEAAEVAMLAAAKASNTGDTIGVMEEQFVGMRELALAA